MSWKAAPLGEICSLITDGKHGDCKNEDNSGYYFISCKDVKDGRINYDNARQIELAGFLETHRRTDLKPGDLLLTNSGTIGRLAIAPDDERTPRTTFQKSVAVLKPIPDKVTPEFLYYSLQSNKKLLINTAGGAAQKNLLLGDLKRFPIKVPSLLQQIHISSILSTYDDLIENNRRRIALLEEAARQLYKEWFVRFHFPGHEHVKIVNGLPEGWERKPIKSVLTLNYGKAMKADDRVEGGYPVYGSSGNVGNHNKPLVKGPGIVVGRKGNVGSVYWVYEDFWPIDTVYFVGPEESTYFVYFAFLNTPFISTDVAVPGLNRDFAYSREILIPLDYLREEFEDEVAPLFSQMKSLRSHNEKLAEARDLLLPKLMSGEIVV